MPLIAPELDNSITFDHISAQFFFLNNLKSILFQKIMLATESHADNQANMQQKTKV